jgi:hypothetical protein
MSLLMTPEWLRAIRRKTVASRLVSTGTIQAVSYPRAISLMRDVDDEEGGGANSVSTGGRDASSAKSREGGLSQFSEGCLDR